MLSSRICDNYMQLYTGKNRNCIYIFDSNFINFTRFTTLHFNGVIYVGINGFVITVVDILLICTVDFVVNCDYVFTKVQWLLVGLSFAAPMTAGSLTSAAARRDAPHAPDSKFCTHTQYCRGCFVALPL